jgi:predicted NBD/HSP70 family sugar kinase
VLVENDANLGALAEAASGAGRAAVDLVYLMVSSSVGAGLVLNGRLYRGSLGLAGEIGHVAAVPGGAVCRCGNRGCLETVIAPPVLLELLRSRHGPLTVGEMIELACGGDRGCRRVLADAGRALGEVVAMLLNVLNPELVVVGGELAAAGDLLLDGVRESLRRAALPAAPVAARVVAGTLGDRSEVLGAIALVVSDAAAGGSGDHQRRERVGARSGRFGVGGAPRRAGQAVDSTRGDVHAWLLVWIRPYVNANSPIPEAASPVRGDAARVSYPWFR